MRGIKNLLLSLCFKYIFCLLRSQPSLPQDTSSPVEGQDAAHEGSRSQHSFGKAQQPRKFALRSAALHLGWKVNLNMQNCHKCFAARSIRMMARLAHPKLPFALPVSCSQIADAVSYMHCPTLCTGVCALEPARAVPWPVQLGGLC